MHAALFPWAFSQAELPARQPLRAAKATGDPAPSTCRVSHHMASFLRFPKPNISVWFLKTSSCASAPSGPFCPESIGGDVLIRCLRGGGRGVERLSQHPPSPHTFPSRELPAEGQRRHRARTCGASTYGATGHRNATRTVAQETDFGGQLAGWRDEVLLGQRTGKACDGRLSAQAPSPVPPQGLHPHRQRRELQTRLS